MSVNLMAEDDWVPEACTLPTVEHPLRRAEFDDLFAEDILTVTQESPQRVRLELRADPDAAARAAGLAVKETGCCSFFTFELTMTDGNVALAISTTPAHKSVLAALGARAESRIGAGG
jgi:hypothetical protein